MTLKGREIKKFIEKRLVVFEDEKDYSVRFSFNDKRIIFEFEEKKETPKTENKTERT